MDKINIILKQFIVIVVLIGTFTVINSEESLTTTFNPLSPEIAALECNTLVANRWLFTNHSETTVEYDVVFQEEKGCIKSENYPDPYTPKSGGKFEIVVEEGYQIDVHLHDVDLDSGAGDYLSIKSGSSGEEAIFMWSYKNSKYIKTLKNVAIINFVVQERAEPITHKGFYLEWAKTGEVIVTTETPSTEPTIPEDIIETFTIYLASDEPEEFVNKQIPLLKELLASSANEYCKDQNIPIKDQITTKNVNINIVSYCPSTWPNFHECIKIIYAIPVFLEETPENNEKYELSKDHLEDMWDQYANKILTALDAKEFNVPNFSGHIEIWVGVSLLIAGLFSLFLYFLWRYDYFYMPSSIRRLSETPSIYGDKPRMSDTSLYPTEHQVIPPMFESLGEPLNGEESVNEFSNRNSFPLYEPEDVLFSQATYNKNQKSVSFFTPNDQFGSYPRGFEA